MLGSPQLHAARTGRRAGTAQVGAHSDVYALGAMLYHLLTARPPFQARPLDDHCWRRCSNTEPVSPRLLNASVPRDLETICLKCLEKEPSRRYATAQAWPMNWAGSWRRSRSWPGRWARPARSWRWCRRKPALATALGAVVLVAAVGFVGILTQWRRAERQWRNAEASELFARQNAYAADMNLAQRALEANDVRLAVSLLNKHRPAGTSQIRNPQPEIDLRHWEWRYLWQLCQADESFRLQTELRLHRRGGDLARWKSAGGANRGDKVALWDLTTKRPMTELPASGCDQKPGALAHRQPVGREHSQCAGRHRRLKCGTCTAREAHAARSTTHRQ